MMAEQAELDEKYILKATRDEAGSRCGQEKGDSLPKGVSNDQICLLTGHREAVLFQVVQYGKPSADVRS